MSTVTMAFAGQTRNLHTMAGILSLGSLYLAGKNPFAGQRHAGLL